MDRNFLQNLSNLTGLPMAQLLEKLGRIDVVDNPFEKADPERVRPEGSVKGAPPQSAPQLQVGNGLSAGAADGGPLPSTTGNGSDAGGAPPQSAPQLQVGNGLSAGAADGGPLPSTTANAAPVTDGAPAGNDPQLQVGNGLSAGAANGGPLPSTTANPAAAAAPRGGGGTQAYQLGGVKEGFWGGVNQLASANNISNPNQLSVGQQIKMPDGSSYTVRGGDTLSGIYQNRAAAAQAAPAPAPAAATPAPTPVSTSAPIDPMTNGERRQGNQFLASSPYEETASPPPEVAAPRPGGSVYPTGTDERTGQPPAAGPRPGGSVYPAGTDERTEGGGIQPPARRTRRPYLGILSGIFGRGRQEGTTAQPVTRSLKNKGAWFSSATHPVIRGY